MKLCSTCDYYLKRHWAGHNTPDHYCRHPLNRHPVDGVAGGPFKMRERAGPCGPNADLHSDNAVDRQPLRFWDRRQ